RRRTRRPHGFAIASHETAIAHRRPILGSDPSPALRPRADACGRPVAAPGFLLTGGLPPLRGFMSPGDFESVCERLRLANGTLWPIPVTLDVTRQVAERLASGDLLTLRNAEGAPLAAVAVEE